MSKNTLERLEIWNYMKAEGSQQTKTCSFAKVAKAPETGVPISSV